MQLQPTSSAAATAQMPLPQPASPAFGDLLTAFRASGGIARADDLARLLSDSGVMDMPSLTDLLNDGAVFDFGWHGMFWVPMFQFDLRRLTVQRAPQRVRDELLGTDRRRDSAAEDGWYSAVWFARAHSELNGRRPVDLLATDLQGVLDIARADHWAAHG